MISGKGKITGSQPAEWPSHNWLTWTDVYTAHAHRLFSMFYTSWSNSASWAKNCRAENSRSCPEAWKSNTVKPVFFACPLFREFREPGKFTKIMGRENLNTAAFQCSRKQKR